MTDTETFVASLNEEELRAWNALDDTQKNVHKNFPSEHWLSDPKHTLHFFMWNTLYRRNLDIAAEHYLGIGLYLYQQIILYLMGISDFIVLIMCRAAAKSFILGVFSTITCILRPKSEVVLTSGTRGQAKMIVSKKIEKEIYNQVGGMLSYEIKKIQTSGDEGRVEFHNNSSIDTVTLGETGLGNRSTVNVFEEAKTCNKETIDKVISPFSHVRTPPYLKKEPYVSMGAKDKSNYFVEEPKEIYISSSVEETHWLYKLAMNTADEMVHDKKQTFLALDYAISLHHLIRTADNLRTMRRKVDGVTWAIEYENRVFRADTNAYFSYDVIKQNRNLVQPFLPRKNEDYLQGKKNPFAIPKQVGEKRIVACDIASINRKANDNSSYSCLRLFPERRAGSTHIDYRVQLPYLEARAGCELKTQAIRIRRLLEDFDADYLVLDLRNCGVALYYILARPLYDPERCVEYAPLKCMNDDELASHIMNEKAEANIYIINATEKLNTAFAQNLQSYFTEKQIDLLLDKEEAMSVLLTLCPSYESLPPNEQLYYDRPFLETAFLINELVELVYEINPRTRNIKISEKSGKRKDRYSSVSYGCYFAQQLALDLISESERGSYDNAPICVSRVDL